MQHCERRVCGPGESGQAARTSLVVVADSAASGEAGSAGAAGGECLLLARPEQGRTHQVRLHCAAAGSPILGDALYGGGEGRGPLQRHGLHALALTLVSPATGAPLEVVAPLADDMRRAALEAGLRMRAAGAGRAGACSDAERAALRDAAALRALTALCPSRAVASYCERHGGRPRWLRCCPRSVC